MAYKTDMTRAINIINCMTPARTVINIPKYIDQSFMEEFKNRDFNIINIGNYDEVDEKVLRKLNNFWNDSKKYPLMVIGNLTSGFESIFTGVYSYVYICPNSIKSYGSQIIKHINTDDSLLLFSNMLSEKKPEFKTEFGNFVKMMYDQNIKILDEHREIFDDKIIIVLI
jgi:hypothetical protein